MLLLHLHFKKEYWLFETNNLRRAKKIFEAHQVKGKKKQSMFIRLMTELQVPLPNHTDLEATADVFVSFLPSLLWVDYGKYASYLWVYGEDYQGCALLTRPKGA